MKWWLLLSLALGCSVNAATQGPSQNLLRNGGFEEELRFWDTRHPVAWERLTAEGDSGALLMRAPFIERDRFVHEVSAKQCVQLDNAELLYIEAKMRFDGLPINRTAHRLNYLWFEDIACTYGGQFGGYLEPEPVTGWQLLDKSDLRPAMNAKSMSIQITQNQSASERELKWFEGVMKWFCDLFGMDYATPIAAAYWDDVLVVPTYYAQAEAPSSLPELGTIYSVGENLMQNGDFGQSAEGWRLSSRAQWLAEQGAVRSAVQSEGSSLGVGVFSQCVKLDGHRLFRMGVRYKQDAASTQVGSGRLRVTWYSEERCRGQYKADTHHADITQESDWQTVLVDGLVRPEMARSAKVEIIQSVAGAGEYAGFWDDAFFTVKE